MKCSIVITDNWSGEQHTYADQVVEADRPDFSKVLGPDGRPLKYEPRQVVGFRLRSSKTNGEK